MALLVLLRGELRHKKSTFIGIMLISFVVALCLSTIVSVNQNASSEVEEALDYVNAGDISVWINDESYSTELIEQCESLKEVDHMAQQEVVTSKEFTINKKKASSSVFLFGYGSQLSSPRVFNEDASGFVDEKSFSIKEDEIILPLAMRDSYSCKKGDLVRMLDAGGNKIELKIAGFVEEPVCGTGFMGIKHAFVSPAFVDKMIASYKEVVSTGAKPQLRYTHFIATYVTKDYKDDVQKVRKLLDEKYKFIVNATLSISRSESANYTNIFTQIFSGVLLAFAVLMFCVVLIVIGHSISTTIELEYSKMGVLKAEGYSNMQLRLLIILQYLFGTVIGEILGCICSIFLVKAYHKLMVGMVGIHATNEIAVWSCMGVMLPILLIIVIVIFVKTRKITKISPVNAIAGGRDEIYFVDRIHLNMVKKSKVPTSIRLAIKEILCDKKSYIGMVLMFAVLTFFMLSVGTMQQVASDDALSQILGSVNYDVNVVVGNVENPDEVVQQIRKKAEEKAQIDNSFYFYSKYLMLDNESYHCSIVSDPSAYKSVYEGRMAKYKNEIVITDIIRDEIHKDVGDKVEVAYKDTKKTFVISGIFSSMTDLGRSCAITTLAMKNLDADNVDKEYCIKFKNEVNAKKIVKELASEFKQYKDSGLVIEGDMGNDIDKMINDGISAVAAAIYGISLIFIAIVVCLVSGKFFFKEQKNMGIYKAFGFTTMQLRLCFALRFFIVALFGSLVGLISNVLLNDSIMTLLLRGMGITNFVTTYSVLMIATAVVFISAATFLFTYLASKRVKKVSVKDLITE